MKQTVHYCSHMLEEQAFLNSCTEFLHMFKTLARALGFYTYLCHQFDAPPTTLHLNNGTLEQGDLNAEYEQKSQKYGHLVNST